MESLAVVSDRLVVNLDPEVFTLSSATGNFISCTFKAKTPAILTIYYTSKYQLHNDTSDHQAECTDVLLVS